MSKVWVCYFLEEPDLRITNNPATAYNILSNYIKEFYNNKAPINLLEEEIFNNLKRSSLKELSKNFLENQNYFGVLDLCHCEAVKVEQ